MSQILSNKLSQKNGFSKSRENLLLQQWMWKQPSGVKLSSLYTVKFKHPTGGTRGKTHFWVKGDFRRVLTSRAAVYEPSPGARFQKYPHSQGLQLRDRSGSTHTSAHGEPLSTHSVIANTHTLPLTPTYRDWTIWHPLNWTWAERRSSYNHRLHQATWEIHEHYT